ncbi:MAG: DinB family protein, partial [Candidatus Krumholzibacteria bacterium]|nr:DinB family protein [Candidatus Krumholzibacteria bacterium]
QDGYRKVTKELMGALKAKWTDATLLETDDMYGETWVRGATLSALLLHEVHHRGEMIVLLRQAGAKVPGLYGPSQEEWSQYGTEPPAY